MKKSFAIYNTTYTVLPCAAIAGCDLYELLDKYGLDSLDCLDELDSSKRNAFNADLEAARQNALYVVSHMNGETFEQVVFGWEMPETMEDYMAMCEDSGAWESDYEVVETVKVID